MKEYIMVFKNTHDAIGTERFIKGKGLDVIVMPTPTYITQSCGICIRFNEEVMSKIEEDLNNKISYKNVYIMVDGGLNIYK